MCEIVKKMWSGIFSNLEISIFFNLSKIYFAKVPKLPKEFYTCIYNLYQFNHICNIRYYREGKRHSYCCPMQRYLYYVAMQQVSAALIYNLMTMKGTVESYLYLIEYYHCHSK